MAYPTFPTNFPAPVLPEVESDSFKEDFKDSTITTTTDANYTITRPRATRKIASWSYSFRAISQEDYTTFINFWLLVGKHSMFWFTPFTGSTGAGTAKLVRFTAKDAWQPFQEGWRGGFTVEEV